MLTMLTRSNIINASQNENIIKVIVFESKLLGECFPQDLMKMTCRQQKFVTERKI